MKKRLLASVLATTLLFLTACTSTSTATSSEDSASATTTSTQEKQDITVFAAASLTDALNDISTEFKKENTEASVTFTFGASGALQTQIEEGAPGDLFFSAAEKQMDALKEKSLLEDDSITKLLENQVVLIVPADSTKEITSFDDLATDKVSSIALGEPASVPVGQYSEEIFTHYNITDEVKTKATYASDVRQVLTWVEEGTVDCGIVYSTDAKTSDKVKVVAIAPEDSHTDVIYPVAILKETSSKKVSKEFLDYLSSDTSKTIFENYGFKNIK